MALLPEIEKFSEEQGTDRKWNQLFLLLLQKNINDVAGANKPPMKVAKRLTNAEARAFGEITRTPSCIFNDFILSTGKEAFVGIREDGKTSIDLNIYLRVKGKIIGNDQIGEWKILLRFQSPFAKILSDFRERVARFDVTEDEKKSLSISGDAPIFFIDSLKISNKGKNSAEAKYALLGELTFKFGNISELKKEYETTAVFTATGKTFNTKFRPIDILFPKTKDAKILGIDVEITPTENAVADMARPDGFLKRYYKVVNQNLQKIKTVYRMYYHKHDLSYDALETAIHPANAINTLKVNYVASILQSSSDIVRFPEAKISDIIPEADKTQQKEIEKKVEDAKNKYEELCRDTSKTERDRQNAKQELDDAKEELTEGSKKTLQSLFSHLMNLTYFGYSSKGQGDVSFRDFRSACILAKDTDPNNGGPGWMNPTFGVSFYTELNIPGTNVNLRWLAPVLGPLGTGLTLASVISQKVGIRSATSTATTAGEYHERVQGDSAFDSQLSSAELSFVFLGDVINKIFNNSMPPDTALIFKDFKFDTGRSWGDPSLIDTINLLDLPIDSFVLYSIFKRILNENNFQTLSKSEFLTILLDNVSMYCLDITSMHNEDELKKYNIPYKDNGRLSITQRGTNTAFKETSLRDPDIQTYTYDQLKAELGKTVPDDATPITINFIDVEEKANIEKSNSKWDGISVPLEHPLYEDRGSISFFRYPMWRNLIYKEATFVIGSPFLSTDATGKVTSGGETVQGVYLFNPIQKFQFSIIENNYIQTSRMTKAVQVGKDEKQQSPAIFPHKVTLQTIPEIGISLRPGQSFYLYDPAVHDWDKKTSEDIFGYEGRYMVTGVTLEWTELYAMSQEKYGRKATIEGQQDTFLQDVEERIPKDKKEERKGSLCPDVADSAPAAVPTE